MLEAPETYVVPEARESIRRPFCPICVLDSVGKLFERLICNRLPAAILSRRDNNVQIVGFADVIAIAVVAKHLHLISLKILVAESSHISKAKKTDEVRSKASQVKTHAETALGNGNTAGKAHHRVVRQLDLFLRWSPESIGNITYCIFFISFYFCLYCLHVKADVRVCPRSEKRNEARRW